MIPATSDEDAVEQLAAEIHAVYEESALKAGWETQPRSRVAWSNVPPANQEATRAVARYVLAALPRPVAPTSREAVEKAIHELRIQAHADGGAGLVRWSPETLRASQSLLTLYDAALTGARGAEGQAVAEYQGRWNDWIAPFHACARCGQSLNWGQSVNVFDRPLISAKCACGVIYSANLSDDDLVRRRAVDDGNKLADILAHPATRDAERQGDAFPTPPAVTAEVDEDDLCEDCLTQKATEFFDAGGANQRCKDCTIKMLRQVCDRLQAEKQTPLDDPQAKGRIAVILRDYANEQPLEVAQRILAALSAPQEGK